MGTEAAAAEPSTTRVPFEFSGKAGEFFRIWIVNVALTILTLGVYSAWAKVRTSQYFYGNTRLDGASFRYLATPMQILKGRVVAVGLLLVYFFSGALGPVISGGVGIAFMLALPALLVMAMAFRLRNAAYRNVRFDYRKNYRQAYALFALPLVLLGAYIVLAVSLMPERVQAATQAAAAPRLPVMLALFPLVLMLSYPLWEYLLVRFFVRHARYGEQDFSYRATAAAYYGMYLLAGLIVLVAGFGFVMIGTGVAGLLGQGGGDAGTAGALASLVTTLSLVPLYLLMFAYIQTRRTNLVFDNIEIGGYRVRSRLETPYMFYLYLTNTLAIVFSLGLLMPWARIRTARYRASRTSVLSRGDLGEFADVQRKGQSALGEEVGEMFDLGPGLGV